MPAMSTQKIIQQTCPSKSWGSAASVANAASCTLPKRSVYADASNAKTALSYATPAEHHWTPMTGLAFRHQSREISSARFVAARTALMIPERTPLFSSS